MFNIIIWSPTVNIRLHQSLLEKMYSLCFTKPVIFSSKALILSYKNRTQLRDLYNAATTGFRKQSFQPKILSLFINPFFFIRRLLYITIKKKAPILNGKLLDFGCGRKPYHNLFIVDEYIGVDVEITGHSHKNSKIDIYYNGKDLPFANNLFDSVFCGEVIEHLMNPEEVLPELYRVMKPKGRMLLTVPFCWNEHEMPFDYARYSSAGIQHLLQKHGFTILSHEKIGTFARVCFQLVALYFFELFKKWGKLGFIISMLFIIPVNIFGLILLPFIPANHTLYFTNILVIEK